MKQTIYTLLALLAVATVNAQIILDDFNDGMTSNWAGPIDGSNSHTYTESGGEMRIDYTNNQPSWYPRAVYTIPGGPIDLSMHRIMRVGVRTYNMSGTVNMRMDMMDVNTYTTNGVPFLLEPVMSDGNLHVYEFDFTGKFFATWWDGIGGSGYWEVDSTQIEKLEFFIDYNLSPAGSDSIWVDFIEMDSSATGGLCAGVTPDPTVLEDFECQRNINYTFTEGFLAATANPDTTGINNTPTVGAYTRNTTVADAWGGSLDLGPLDFTGENQITLQFLNNYDPVEVLVIFQNSALQDLANLGAISSGGGVWEELTYDFSAITNEADISNIVMLIGAGDTSIGENIYYLDNLQLGGFTTDPCAGVPVDPAIMEDFECQQNLQYNFVEGSLQQGVTNPDPSGVNTTAKVGRYTRNAAETDAFGGEFLEAPLDFDTYDFVTMDVYSPAAPFMATIVLQDVNGTDLSTVDAICNDPNTWEELTFDFSNIPNAAGVGRIVMLFDVGNLAAAGNVYYFDNLKLSSDDPCAGIAVDPNIMEDFECQQNLDYTFAEGAFQAGINNPDATGINITEKVGRYTRNGEESDAFGGTFTEAPLDFDANNYVKMDVYSPVAPFTTTIVLQDMTGSDLGSAEATANTADTWERLIFDFSAVPNAAGVSRIVMLFDAGNVGAAGNVYYFDNLRLDSDVGIEGEILEALNMDIYPNPANGLMNVDFTLSAAADVSVKVIDLQGKEVETLLGSSKMYPGNHQLQWETSNVAEGIYLLQMQVGDMIGSKKLMILK